MNRAKSNFLILSWALYDLANQFFALNVVSLYFPRWLTIKKGSPEIFYSLSFGVSMLFVAVCAPVLGTVSDMRGRRKEFLIYFTLLSIICTMALGLCRGVFSALMFFAIANFGCQGAVVFYNALMVDIAPRDRIGFVSGLGRMFGYCGALLALYLTKPVVLQFGYQSTFFLTGVLFLIFSLPCMIFIKEKPSKETPAMSTFLKRQGLREAFRRLKETIFDSYKFGKVRNFLKAAFFGLCVVNTIILFMSIYASKVFGLTEAQIIDLIAFSTLFAILGSIFSGFIGDIIGYRRSLIGIFFLWAICLLGGSLLKPPFHWLIGAVVGVSLGSTWVICRALLVKLVPRENIGEFFGLFNLAGYAAGIIGPVFWGLVLLGLSPLGAVRYRIAFLSLILFIVVGFIFLLNMDKDAKRQKSYAGSS
ncbi:MFS transporter [Candidatus Omnitrophota bacterium]